MTTDIQDDSGTTPVTDLDTFVKLLASWHGKRVQRLEQLLIIPEGTEVSMGEEPAFALTGEALKGFRVGVAISLSQLGKLPFEAEFESIPDGKPH
jgi:hypothetical protein